MGVYMDTQTCVETERGPGLCTHCGIKPGLTILSQMRVHIVTTGAYGHRCVHTIMGKVHADVHRHKHTGTDPVAHARSHRPMHTTKHRCTHSTGHSDPCTRQTYTV